MATNRGLGIRDVFIKMRPEKPKPGRCMKTDENDSDEILTQGK
jgi:hypothetical protein